MRSERMKPQTPAEIDPPHRHHHYRLSRRRLLGVAIAGLGPLALTACAEGTARDAKRGKEADAKRTSVVDEIQATESANLIKHPSTPSPDPTGE